jgi:hypothetical protein
MMPIDVIIKYPGSAVYERVDCLEKLAGLLSKIRSATKQGIVPGSVVSSLDLVENIRRNVVNVDAELLRSRPYHFLRFTERSLNAIKDRGKLVLSVPVAQPVIKGAFLAVKIHRALGGLQAAFAAVIACVKRESFHS